MRPTHSAKRSIWPLDMLLRLTGGSHPDSAAPFTLQPPETDHQALDGLERYVDSKPTASAAEGVRRPVPGKDIAPFYPKPRQPSEEAKLIEAWGALGGRLAVVLKKPVGMREFVERTLECEAELKALRLRNPDAALYLMFQLSQSMHAGYSTSHALLSACLCGMLGETLKLGAGELASLTRAALTMNIAVTALQDQLARQAHALSPEQQGQILAHAVMSRLVLEKAGVRDALWLDIVEDHHLAIPEGTDRSDPSRPLRLIQLLGAVDRYGAFLAARRSRPSRSAENSAQTLLESRSVIDGIENTLINTVGLYPPGTYVRLQSLEAAVVVRRGNQPHAPMVVTVQSATGRSLRQKVLCDTSNPGHGIVESLAACDVEIRLNHEEILQLAQTAPAAAPPNWELQTARLPVH